MKTFQQSTTNCNNIRTFYVNNVFIFEIVYKMNNYLLNSMIVYKHFIICNNAYKHVNIFRFL